MAPKAKGKARGKANARPKVKASAKAKAQAAAEAQRESKKHQNKMARRAAVTELNILAATVGVKTVKVKNAKWKKVERLIGLLEGRCQEQGPAATLRAAAEKWVTHGGKLSYGLFERPRASAAEDGEPVVPFHKVLIKGFQLETHACMVTYNSPGFTLETWGPYEEWFRHLAKRLGMHAWAACLEESLHAGSTQQRYHLHGYMYWKGGDGLIRRNTDDLVFQDVRPRVDLCTRTNPVRLKLAALQGHYYVYIMKLGTKAVASNWMPWRDYTPKAEWLDAWWMAHKLSHSQYNDYSMGIPLWPLKAQARLRRSAAE